MTAVLNLKRVLGLDRAIAYTSLARLLQIVGSTGTVLLIVRFLSPTEQGYYYALLSLVSLQAIFELGFSFVIQQLAAHESVHLQFLPDGRVLGPPEFCSRLASILQLTVRWYSRAAVMMLAILLPGGWLFFIHRQVPDHVSWQLPWCCAAVACAGAFLLAPLYSFLDGCGQVRQVASLRLGEAVAAVACAWTAMIAHKGLYSPFMVIAGQVAVGFVFLWQRRRLLSHLYRRSSSEHQISWKTEIFPFQWKIAVSWICAYFTAQAFVPLLFALRGPIDAGQMGMSLSITGYMSVLLLAWISTKATPFGQLIASRAYEKLDQLFFRAFRQSFTILATLAFAAMAVMMAIQHLFPRLASRLVSPLVFLLLLITMLSSFVVQSLAVFLRSFKREPFLKPYLITALFTVGSVIVTARRWGALGVSIGYFACTGIFGLAAAITIFNRFRRQFGLGATPALEAENAG